MQVTKVGQYHVPASFDISRDVHWRDTLTVPGQPPTTVMIFISDDKADKHAIGTHWPIQQPGAHTGITIADDDFKPLYKTIGFDLVKQCISRGGGQTWLELKYEANELPGQYFSANVATRAFMQVRSITVGGSVGFHAQHGYFVFINHGPY